MSQNYFLNYTKTDKNKKPVLKWNRLDNVNFLHFCYKLIIILIIILLSSCGMINYRTEVYIEGKKKAEVISNVPAKVKVSDVEVDQRNETIYEKLGKILPKNIKVEQ